MQTVLGTVLLLVISIGSVFVTGDTLTLHQVQAQDVPVLVPLCLSILVAVFWSPEWRLPAKLPPWWAFLLTGLAVAALLAWGNYAVFSNYSLSRDTQMVQFDMKVYDSGHLAMPLAPFWRPYARAMAPDFLLIPNMPTGLVSSYLPVNAVLRLLFSKVADPAWYNPLLAVAGGAALLDIARRLFGAEDRACWVVLLVYTLSAQVLLNAMNAFSMTGHMALNLIWLAAFLRGGKVGTMAAILAGFLATGLHQLVYHPFFVAPFLLWRLRQGEWRLVLFYAFAYAAILAWWAFYPTLASAQAAAPIGDARDYGSFTHKIWRFLSHRTPGTDGLMVMNLLRFFAWQNFVLIPLLVTAVPMAMRERGFASVLLLGIAAWLVFITIVEPYQGLGWGYHYLSPYIGSFALLAGYGYRELERRLGPRSDGMVIVLSGLTLALAIPILIVSTLAFRFPYVALDRFIEAQSTLFVLINTEVTPTVDSSWATHPFDQVRNMPDLSNRPLRFSSNQMDADMLAALCHRGAVTLITRSDMHRIGFEANVPLPSPQFDALVSAARQKTPGCFRPAQFSNVKAPNR